ncbi:MAG: hypothetical protein ABSF97_01820 [Candidatus Sulfotelmatobacter sp.]|jgi:hypothetical protein
MSERDTIAEVGRGSSRFRGLDLNLVLAFYCSLLLVFLEGGRPPFGVGPKLRYLYLWHPHAISLQTSDFVLFYAELLLIPAVAFFVCLELVRRRFSARILTWVGGTMVIGGFPLACLYGVGSPWFAIVELLIASCCFILWLYGKWHLSEAVSAFLLFIHYAFWFCLSGLIMRIVPTTRVWEWGKVWDYVMFGCPVVGLFFSLLWAWYFRRFSASAPANNI